MTPDPEVVHLNPLCSVNVFRLSLSEEARTGDPSREWSR